jgi:hypothetical protein
MKKNLFYYLFAVICSVTLFTSCSDDDDEKMVNPVPQTTFTGYTVSTSKSFQPVSHSSISLHSKPAP